MLFVRHHTSGPKSRRRSHTIVTQCDHLMTRHTFRPSLTTMTPGTPYLIPNTLGSSDAAPAAQLHAVIPQQVQAISAGLTYFIAENAKTTRAFLSLLKAVQPLAL